MSIHVMHQLLLSLWSLGKSEHAKGTAGPVVLFHVRVENLWVHVFREQFLTQQAFVHFDCFPFSQCAPKSKTQRVLYYIKRGTTQQKLFSQIWVNPT